MFSKMRHRTTSGMYKPIRFYVSLRDFGFGLVSDDILGWTFSLGPFHIARDMDLEK